MGIRKQQEVKKWDIHPVWRGIGCLYFVIMPVIAYALAYILVEQRIVQQYIPLPSDMYERVFIPYINLAQPHFKANLVVAFGLTIVLYSFWTVLYAFVYRAAMGGKRYGPTDSPPIKRKGRKTSKNR